jgi:DNA-binding MarR family transcriptional regulator
MVERFEKFTFAISEISRNWHKIAAEEMEKYGLKGPYAVYFTTLYRFSDGITAANLGELCGRDKSDVSRAVTLLESKGLILRESNQNRYRALLKLTDEGKSIAEKINRVAMEVTEYVGRDLSQKHREIFYECLDSIIANMQSFAQKEQ